MKLTHKIFVDGNRFPTEFFNISKYWSRSVNYRGFVKKISKIVNDAENWINCVSFGKLEGKDNELQCLKFLLLICNKYGLQTPKIFIHNKDVLTPDFFTEIEKFKIKTGMPVTIEEVNNVLSCR